MSSTPNLNDLVSQLSRVFTTMSNDPDGSENTNNINPQNWIEVLGEIKNLKVEGKLPQGMFSGPSSRTPSKSKDNQPISKLMRDFASSKNQNIQQKFGNLCLHLEEVIESLPKIQAAMSTLSSLQVKLDYSLSRFNKTLQEVRQLYQAEVVNIQCIEKRIKNPPAPLNMSVLNTPQYHEGKFLFPFTEPRKGFLEESETSINSLIEEIPQKKCDMPILSAFDMVFKEIKYQISEGYITKREHLMSSSKLELNYITIKHNMTERSGFLVQGSGHVLFVLPNNDIWQLVKAMAKGDSERCMENFFVPLLTQNQVYKVEINDSRNLKALFTPLQKI